jgi:adenosylmethionine-8-amino-7-oxononanoate aminotransferase
MTPYGYPNGHIFYRRIQHDHAMISHGEGVYLYDVKGKRYLDASGGALVTNIGHGVSEVADAIAAQANRVAIVHPTQFTSQPLEDYAAALAEVCPLPDPRFYFLSTGSEVVETALKLARQIQIERGEAGRHITISRWLSYHGVTLGALSVTGKVKMRQHYLPMLHDVPHIPPVYCYRCPFDHSYPVCGLRCANALEEEIRRTGAENVAAFIAEPFSGATLGAIIPPDGYWQRIRQICDQYGILLIADEVMTGMGRTGKWFAVEHFNITPDIITIAKGTSAGYMPFSAAAVRGEHVDLIVKNGHDFVHGGTFSHHPVAAAGALATLRYLQEHDLVAAVARKGKILGAKLHQALDDLPIVGDMRGIGMMWGIEFVSNRTNREPFPPEQAIAQRIADEAFQRGLVVYPITGCVDGVSGDHIMIGPPFIIEETHMDELCAKLRAAIEYVAQDLPG